MHIRSFQTSDAAALWQVFHSAVHQLAATHYSPAQRQAWAPDTPDWPAWRLCLQQLRPFVAIDALGQALGYADLQAEGYIDQFFVAPSASHMGVGSHLMQYIHQQATERGLTQLSADVSLNAQPFFTRHGFSILRQQSPVIRGIALSNAHMRKTL